MHTKLSVVIPCFNERATIGILLERVLNVQLPSSWEKEIIVVDDGSTDGTPEIVERFRVRLIRRIKNGGKGTALVDGFREATGTHVLIQDADLEYDPSDIPKLLKAVAPRVVVYGSRNLRHERSGSRILRSGVWLLTKLVNLLYGTKLTDLCTCYKLMPREAAAYFHTGGFEADMRIAGALIRHGYTITEVPISYSARTVAEGKKIKYLDGFEAFFVILADYWSDIMRK